MRNVLILFLMFFLAGNFGVLGQQSAIYTNKLSEFDNAIFLFKDKQYQSAQILFEKVKQNNNSQDIQADCAYYIGICAIHLNQNNADEIMEQFVADYPTSSKQNQAYIEVAQYYFQQGKFPQALQYFDKVDESALTLEETEKFTFQKGYAYFTAGNKKEASSYFNKVINSKEFGSQAKYYLGFMAYEGDNYKEATKYFDQVSGEEKYKEKLSYFKADMHFKLGEFQKAIDAGIAAMPKSKLICAFTPNTKCCKTGTFGSSVASKATFQALEIGPPLCQASQASR